VYKVGEWRLGREWDKEGGGTRSIVLDELRLSRWLSCSLLVFPCSLLVMMVQMCQERTRLWPMT
jgi:hypothetical protein